MRLRGQRRSGAIMLMTGVALSHSVSGQIGPESDPAIEQCLAHGEILKKLETLVGVTKPERFKIECDDGRERSAVLKTLDEHRRGVTRLQRGGTEFNFSDSYKYERAAYLLDRELGIDMVPVAVIRTFKGDQGALIAWIESAAHENEMKSRPTGPQMAALARDKAVMRLFDALICNVDRRPENWMVDRDTWKLYLIDHSRAFRNHNDPPEDFLAKRARLSKDLYEKLAALDRTRLDEMLTDLLTGDQIESLLERRDRILEKIDRDREEFGDAVIFSG